MGVPESDVSSFARVAEITRKLYRQSNADAVMTSTVQEIGAQWNVNRCIVAMRKPGLLPSAVKEYCSEGLKKGEGTALARLVATVQDEAVARGSLMSSDAGATAELQAKTLECLGWRGPKHAMRLIKKAGHSSS